MPRVILLAYLIKSQSLYRTENPVVGILTPYCSNVFSDCRFTFLEDKRSNEHSMVLDVLRYVSLSHVHVYGELGMCAFRVTWWARATPFRNTQDKDTANPHSGGGTLARRQQNSLNEGYFGNFTFPGQGPSISQAQFDLYGGEEQLKHNKHSLIS
ncbi:hypothetical protein PIB30_038690 [Stylosanthes scabra]|uniref:Uncharacterized protein n=1 Tax=Stylosanthes scabra TaxID=79078 RepID=A0ABU6ZCT1_9FABA|nr:hypothetical protein [Stylosanthes scabra]